LSQYSCKHSISALK